MALTTGTLKPTSEYPLKAGIGVFTYHTSDNILPAGSGANAVFNAGYFNGDNRITATGALIDVISNSTTTAQAGYTRLFAVRGSDGVVDVSAAVDRVATPA